MEEEKKEQINKDWNTDYFPTSAKPVFRSTGILILIIIGLCIGAYFYSEKDSVTNDNAISVSKDDFSEEEVLGNVEDYGEE